MRDPAGIHAMKRGSPVLMGVVLVAATWAVPSIQPAASGVGDPSERAGLAAVAPSAQTSSTAAEAPVKTGARPVQRRVLEDPPESIVLSWKAPLGRPGATDALVPACDDTSRADTLFLGFYPGKQPFTPVAMEAVLYFHPAPGDTLLPFWFFKRGWPNNGNLRIDFDRATGFPCEMPWPWALGHGRVSYDHRSGRGRLDLSFVASPDMDPGLDSYRRYCLARVMFTHLGTDLPGCRQPVCVEFASLRLKPSQGPEYEITQGDHRFVTWNSSGGAGCAPHRRAPLVRPWRPNVPTGDTPATLDFVRPEPISQPEE